MAELSSLNSRLHAPRPVTDFSDRIRSSGSVRRCGRYRRADARWCVQKASRSSASSGPARSSGTAAHSSSKNRMRVLIAVGALLDPLSSAPFSGSLRVDREPEAGVRARPAQQLPDPTELLHERGEALGVELADLAPPLLDRDGEPVGLLELLVDAGDAAAVDERLEVPPDIGGGPVGVGDGRHEVPNGSRASGNGAVCATVSVRVARVRIT